VKPAVQQFIDFLVADMEASQSTAYATALLTQAKTKITAGAGEVGFVDSANINGKNFTRSRELSALDIALACRKAIDLYDDTDGPSITFADFSRI
jgi:hypothetical protein